jgi:L,D-transpeptidase ErfK/SrfK
MRFCYLVSVKHVLLLTFGGVLVIAFAAEALRLEHAVQAETQITQTLLEETRDFRTTAVTMQREADDLNFLRSLLNVMPQEKGFIRTQRAISSDVEMLRAKVSRRIHNDVHVLVDVQANKLYVKRGLTLLWQSDCSVGRGGMLTDKKTGQRWEFVTPHGQFEIREKMADPLWIKPDWAFVEAGEKVPPPGDPTRAVKDELGAFVMSLGDGYLIHGTKNEKLLGHPASHGCVRLGRDDLKRLYELAPRGTRVYIY